MSVEPKDGRLSVVTRERLAVTLAAPFLLLLASSLASWPWRSLGLPGAVGTMTPPGILLLALAVAAAMLALRRGLPLGMITWLPAGQGAIVLLTTGFVAETPTAAAGAAVIVGYVLIYLIALGVALAVAGHGGCAWRRLHLSLPPHADRQISHLWGRLERRRDRGRPPDIHGGGPGDGRDGVRDCADAPPRRSAGGPSRRQRRAPRGARGPTRSLRLPGRTRCCEASSTCSR